MEAQIFSLMKAPFLMNDTLHLQEFHAVALLDLVAQHLELLDAATDR
jgi:hypothetical protein